MKKFNKTESPDEMITIRKSKLAEMIREIVQEELAKQQKKSELWTYGGDLTNAGKKLRDWMNATYENKLASCGDAIMFLKEGPGSEKWNPNINFLNANDMLVNYVVPLMVCIDMFEDLESIAHLDMAIVFFMSAHQLGYIGVDVANEVRKQGFENVI